MSTIPKLDVRTIPPAQRHPEIFGAFDALEPDEAFVLVNDHDPKPLLYQFQAERSGCFEWSVLEQGPEQFRIEIRRRADAGPRSVTDYLEADHRRLDDMVPAIRTSVAAGSFDEASAQFAEFSCGLRRHIELEEQVLFPIFEEKSGMREGGPTAVMRHEHVEILRIVDAVTVALATKRGDDANESIDQLVEVLGAHNMKEERVLYPMTDRALGDDRARDDLVKQLQAF